MTSIDIYSILSSKPHNEHYLKRYYKLIISLQNTPYSSNLEKHHICPKASDLFPEFKVFKNNRWNQINLTPRQHFVAHWLLWKAYGGQQREAFWFMNALKDLHGRKSFKKLNSRQYQLLKEEKAKFLTYTQIKSGEKLKLEKSDYRVTQGEYIHFNKGREKSEQTRKLIGENQKRFFANMSEDERKKFRRKQSESLIGRIVSDETRKKIALANTGFIASDETREKMRKSRSGSSYYINDKNERIRALPDDDRLKIGVWVLDSCMQNMAVYKDKNGNRLKLSNTDPRVLSGEFVGTKSKKFSQMEQ